MAFFQQRHNHVAKKIQTDFRIELQAKRAWAFQKIDQAELGVQILLDGRFEMEQNQSQEVQVVARPILNVAVRELVVDLQIFVPEVEVERQLWQIGRIW